MALRDEIRGHMLGELSYVSNPGDNKVIGTHKNARTALTWRLWHRSFLLLTSVLLGEWTAAGPRSLCGRPWEGLLES